MTAPQLSPGREWWWTGAEWVPAATHPDAQAALAALEAPAPEPDPVVFAPAQPYVATPPPYVPTQPQVPYAQPWVNPKPPFDTLGLVSILLNLFPFLALGQIAAVIVSKQADKKRDAMGYPRSGMAAVGRILGYVFGTLIGLGVLLAILLPVFLHARHPGTSAPQRAIQRADAAAVEVDARNAVNVETQYYAEFGIYTTLPGLLAHGYRPSAGVTTNVLSADRSRFCLQVSARDTTLFYDSTTSLLSTRPCS